MYKGIMNKDRNQKTRT